MGENLRPWDIFNRNIEKVSPEFKKERMDICNSCEFLIKGVNVCKKCGCQMDAKTQLVHSSCPIGKWQAIRVIEKDELNGK